MFGIGPVTALHLYNKGYRTIEDLRRNQQMFNEEQKVKLFLFTISQHV